MRHTAASTANYVRLDTSLKEVSSLLMKILRTFPFSFGRAFKVSDDDANALRVALNAALPNLDIQFTDPSRKLPSKLATRLKNFRKMLTQMRDASNGEALGAVLASMDGKTTSAWEKYLEYRDEILAIVNALDEETLSASTMGPYSVQPFNTGRGDWSEEKWETLQYVLHEGARLLASHGLGKYVGGAVLAYPTKVLPPSTGSAGGVLAMYRRTDDLMWLATAGERKRILLNFIHETGHRVYWRFLGNRGRAAWDAYFEGDTGVPDIDAVLREWEAWASAPSTEQGNMPIDEWNRRKYGRYLAFWMQHLLKTGQRELAMWTEIIAQKAGVDEKYDVIREVPRKNQVPGLDTILAKRNEIKSFLTPVTAYSATSAGELFAEAFAHYIVNGPSRLHPKLNAELRRALPTLKMASLAPTKLLPGGPLMLQPDYGKSNAPLPRGEDEPGPSAYRIASRYLRLSKA
jgi:hypothetical protein